MGSHRIQGMLVAQGSCVDWDGASPSDHPRTDTQRDRDRNSETGPSVPTMSGKVYVLLGEIGT